MTRTSIAIFRTHRFPADAAPPGRGIYGQLASEWSRLCASAAAGSTIRRWARSEPHLTGLASAGQIVDAIDTADPARTDELIRALLNLFHSGQQLAGRVLLQAMLPKLSHTAKARRGSNNLDLDPEDRRCNTIAAFWEVLAHPGAGRTSNLAGSLALDTLNLLTRPSRRTESEDAVEPDWFEHNQQHRRRHLPDIAEPITDSHEPNQHWPLEQFIDWGLQVHAINSAEAAALTAVADTWPQPSNQVATQLGLTPANLRQRCSRATRSLAAAVHEQADQIRQLELAS